MNRPIRFTPRRGLRVTTRLFLLLLGGAAAAPARAQTPEYVMEAADFIGLRGDYRLPSGDTAILAGWPAQGSWRQRLFFEVEGERRPLRMLARDRFLTAEGDTLRVVRGAGGVSGLAWTGAEGGVKTLAPRVALYSEQEVSFTSLGVKLVGTLLLPPGPGPHPAVVFVHGSGPDWREPYRTLADHFARNGIAALIYDKRGVGASAGDWQMASFEELADDAIAAVELLRSRPEIEPARVGLWGISQGGWIVPLAATRSASVGFIIPVSGSGVSPATQELWRIGNNLRYRKLSPAAIELGIRANQMFYSLKPLAERGWITLPPSIWFRSLDLWMDPSRIWERVRQPVFGIWGEVDGLVPTPESVQLVRTALERGGNQRYTLRIFAGGEHNLLRAVEGFQNEPLPRIAYVDGYREAMVEWVHALPSGAEGARVVVPEGATPTRLAWHGSAREPVPLFGQAVVQVPLVVGLALVFLWASVGAPLVRGVRRLRSRGRAAESGLGQARLLAGIGGALGVVAVAGWASTLVQTLLEGGDPFLGGHPLGLVVARAAAVGTVLAFAGLGAGVVGLWRERRLGVGARIGYSLALVAGLAFIRWAWYWGLFHGT